MKLTMKSYVALLLVLTTVGQIAGQQVCFPVLDLCFVVDGSGSICNDADVTTCDNWKSLLRLIHALVDGMEIGLDRIRVAMIVFESSAWVEWSLTRYTTKAALLDAIDNLRYPGGNTNTPAALDLLLTQIFTGSGGDRPWVNNTAIIITDGKPRRGRDPIPAAEVQAAIDRVHSRGITTIVVGVTGSVDDFTLRQLSSYPHTLGVNYFRVIDYSQIGTIRGQLSERVCKDPPPSCPKRDLIFVIDDSRSICDADPRYSYSRDTSCSYWSLFIQFVHNIVDNMNIGSNDDHVALVSSNATWGLNTYNDKNQLLLRIDDLKFPKDGVSVLVNSLTKVKNQIIGSTGDRAEVGNTIVVITNGNGAQVSTLKPAMDAILASNTNRAFAVGINIAGNIDPILDALSSYPNLINITKFVANDYGSLDSVARPPLESAACTNVMGVTPKPSNGTEQKQECRFLAIDLTFVVDASGSICDTSEGFNYTMDTSCKNWENNLKFIENIIWHLDIGPDRTRVGLVTFQTTSRVEWNLIRYTDNTSLVNAVRAIRYIKGGTTDLTGGLRLARTQCFGIDGDRPNVTNIAVVITDGYPTEPSTLQPEIDADTQAGLTVLAIGVTNKVNDDILQRISSPPHTKDVTVFRADNYTALDAAVRAKLVTQICPASTAVPIITGPPIIPSTTGRPLECTRAGDVALLVDVSGSICDSDTNFDYDTDNTCNNWRLVIQFLVSLVRYIPNIGTKGTEVALVTFGDAARVQWNLDRYTNVDALVGAINGLTYSKGQTTALTDALRVARTQVFGTSADRPGFNNTLVLITDGFPTQTQTLENEILACRSAGIRAITFGVTREVENNTLRRISSPPQLPNVTFFQAIDFNEMQYYYEQIVQRICIET